MKTPEQLTQVFNNNFVAYYRSHVAHVNILGRNFYSDHKLLQKIYERRQEQIDKLAELLRSIDEYMPCEIQDVLNQSEIGTGIFEEDADGFLHGVKNDLELLKGSYEGLMTVAEKEGHEEIANYAQEQILDLAKSIWMLNSTLE
jgi:DNA-binding ferritin-like protein